MSDSRAYGDQLLTLVKNNQTETALELLKKAEANDAKNDYSTTDDNCHPLHWAVRNENHTLIKALIVADPKRLAQKSNNGQTPIQIAAQLKKWDCIKTIATTHPCIKGSNYGGALVSVIKANQIDLAKLLLEAGAENNFYANSDDCGWHSLHWAVQNKNLELIPILLQKGHDPNVKGEKQKITPIELALSLGREYQRCVVALKSRSVQSEIKMSDNSNDLKQEPQKELNSSALVKSKELSPSEPDDKERVKSYSKVLYLNTEKNQSKAALVLLSKITSTKWAKNDWKSTETHYYPLHWAVFYADIQLIEALIRADYKRLSQENKWGDTPIQIAARLEKWDIVQKIIAIQNSISNSNIQGAHYGGALVEAVKLNKKNIVKLLLKAGAEKNFYIDDTNGWYSLHWAVSNNNIELISLLLQAGHDPLQKSEKTKETPFELATRLGYENCVIALTQVTKSNSTYLNFDNLKNVILAIAKGELNKETLEELAQKKLFKETVLDYINKQLYYIDDIFLLNQKSLGLEQFFGVPRGWTATNAKKGTLHSFIVLRATWEKHYQKQKEQKSLLSQDKRETVSTVSKNQHACSFEMPPPYASWPIPSAPPLSLLSEDNNIYMSVEDDAKHLHHLRSSFSADSSSSAISVVSSEHESMYPGLTEEPSSKLEEKSTTPRSSSADMLSFLASSLPKKVPLSSDLSEQAPSAVLTAKQASFVVDEAPPVQPPISGNSPSLVTELPEQKPQEPAVEPLPHVSANSHFKAKQKLQKIKKNAKKSGKKRVILNGV
jgi:ankyrin repeat protein